MFGMALRAYQRKVRRLAAAGTEREPTLWKALLDTIAEAGSLTRGELLDRHAREDEALVRGVLRDLVESGVVDCSGHGPSARYRLPTEHELQQRAGERERGLDELLWALCGRCTLPCTERSACAELSAEATCAPVQTDGAACTSSGVPAHACVLSCSADADCAELGEGFECVEWQCLEAASALEPPPFAATPDDRCRGEACAVAEQPLVMLLVDSSGSMERKTNCTCTTPACTECLPDCTRGERNRWVEVLDALGGTIDGYGCEALDRTEANGATFDLGYHLPHHARRAGRRRRARPVPRSGALRFCDL